MSSTVPPMDAVRFFGTKRAWGTSSAEETHELLTIAAHMGQERPIKRARLNAPQDGQGHLENLWSTYLPSVERGNFEDVDKFFQLVDETEIAELAKGETQRKKMYCELPAPTIIPDGEVQHKVWAYTPEEYEGGIVRVKVARQKTREYPKHFVVFSLLKDELIHALEPLSDMLECEDGVSIPISGLSFSEDADKTPTITIDTVDETPEDWELMCRALFLTETFVKTPQHWDDIGRLLELSRKYNCLPLRDAAVSFLSNVYPTNFDNYKKRFTKEQYTKVYGRPMYWQAEALIRFALPYRLYELLPMVRFVVAASYSLEELLLGWPENGGRPEMQLPDDELERLLKGQEALTHMRRLHTLKPLVNMSRVDPIDKECMHTNAGYSCHHALALFVDQLLQNKTVWSPKYALRTLDGRITRLLRPFVCTGCFSQLKIKLAAAQREAWKNLPTIFGMGTWFDVQIRADWIRKSDYEWWLAKEKKRVDAQRGPSDLTPEELKQKEYWDLMNQMSAQVLQEGVFDYAEYVIQLEHQAFVHAETMGPQSILALANLAPQPVITVAEGDAGSFVTGLVQENPHFTFVGDNVQNDLNTALAVGGIGNVLNGAAAQNIAQPQGFADEDFEIEGEEDEDEDEEWGSEGEEGEDEEDE